jgi:hypothetical protein
MISFRLSEEEYANLRVVCEAEGARSVSDLARDAVHRLVRQQGSVPLESVLQELAGRVDLLDMQVQRLTLALGSQNGERMRQSNGKA